MDSAKQNYIVTGLKGIESGLDFCKPNRMTEWRQSSAYMSEVYGDVESLSRNILNWANVRAIHEPWIYGKSVTNFEWRPFASGLQVFAPTYDELPSEFLNSGNDFDEENDILRKIKRELKRRQNVFEEGLTEKTILELSSVILFIVEKVSYNLMGLELTKGGSFIFTLFMDNDVTVYIIYNGKNDDDEKLFYRIFEKDKHLKQEIGTVGYILATMEDEKLIVNREITPFIGYYASPDSLKISMGRTRIVEKNTPRNEYIPTKTLIPSTI